jgi:two-component system, chemotaxis family, chemotaxis protein CheY
MERILVVEDNAPLCWLIERMLRSRYCVSVLSNPLEAVSWLQDGNHCDLIITDLEMPEMTGIDLLQVLKSGGLYQQIPVIVLSASDDKAAECFKEGASAFICKPFNPQQLSETIRNVLGTSMNKVIAA